MTEQAQPQGIPIDFNELLTAVHNQYMNQMQELIQKNAELTVLSRARSARIAELESTVEALTETPEEASTVPASAGHVFSELAFGDPTTEPFPLG